MSHIELVAPERTDLFVIDTIVRYKLVATLKSLESYPGSLHWTLSKPGEAGRFEVTFWPRKGRLWLSRHQSENAPWVEETVQLFVTRFGKTQDRSA